MNILDELNKYISQDDWWMLHIFIIIFAALIIDFFQKRVLNKVQARLKNTKTAWDDALIHAVKKPLSLLIWIYGLSFALDIINVPQTQTLREVIIIICAAWVAVRFIKFAEKNILHQQQIKGKPIDKSTADAISQLLRVTVIITSFLVALQTMGFNISAILAFGGIGGIAIGFAAKDLLSNFFGGLMIYLDRPFAIGDWIRSPDKEIEGTVEKIGWRLTVIRTFDKRPLYIPNSVFASIAVENPSRMTNRRIYETIGIRYDDVKLLPVIVDEVRVMLQSHKEIDTNNTLIVNFNKFSESSLDFFIYTFTKTTDWQHYHHVKQDVLFKINDIIAKHGADIAFPTSTLHVPKGVPVFNEPGEHV